jgi:HK97 family phage major capsid protein
MSTDVINALKKFGETQGQQWEEFKKSNDARLEKIEKGEHVEALLTEKTAKIDADLSVQSEKMDTMRRKMDAQRWYTQDGHAAGLSDRDMAYKSAWWEALKYRGKKDSEVPEELKQQMLDNEPEYVARLKTYDGATGTGLEWAPNDFIDELWRDVVENSPVVGLMRRYPTSRKSIEVPTHTGGGPAVWVAQAAARGALVTPTTALITIPTNEISARYTAARESLEDVPMGLESIIRQDQAEQIALLLGTGIIAGTGSAQPQGFMSDAGANTFVFATGGPITGDDIIGTYYDVKTSYAKSGTWLANRATLSAIRQLKSTGTPGQYLWTPGFGVAPDLILGRPVVETIDMEGTAVNDHAIAFGDWKRAYALADRVGFRTLVDPYSQAANGLVDFYGYLRIGGEPIKFEAYTLGTIAAS